MFKLSSEERCSARFPHSPIPRAQFEFYSIMSHASGNALGGAISPADVSLVQHLVTIRPP
jgi:hypothetical protein